jgi:hypothetical protein
MEEALRHRGTPPKTGERQRSASAGRNAAERRRHALQRAAQALKHVLKHMSPDEAEAFADHIEEAASTESSTSSFARELTGREYTPQQRVELESIMAARAFERRQELLAGALTASQVARLLHTTRQTPYDRARSGSLLAVYDRGAWRFPAWQFDAEGRDGILPGLASVLRALQVRELAKVSWLVMPNAVLEGRPPVEVLKQGEVDRVLEAARGVGVV